MIANYHTHTWRCNHAEGTEEAYVRAALSRNFEILGFSDHTPYCFPGDYYSHFRMRPEQLADYCQTIRGLQHKFAGQIQIPLGVEMEYYPDLFPEQLKRLREAGVEYLLLGQHFVGNEMGDHYCGHPTGEEEILARYCAQSRDAMQTGLFTYFAHPDLINFKGAPEVYRAHMAALCREAKSCGIPLELNLLGAWTGRHYPNPAFWEIAAEEGCSVILGCDAHAPEGLLQTDAEQVLVNLAQGFDLKLLEKTDIRHI